MSVFAFASDLLFVQGQFSVTADILETLDNGYLVSLDDRITADLESVGVEEPDAYYIDWYATFYDLSLPANAPLLQSPLLKTYRICSVVLYQGAASADFYVNYKSQRTPFYRFLLGNANIPYPSEPPFNPVGEVDNIYGPTGDASLCGDSLVFLPQYADIDTTVTITWSAVRPPIPGDNVFTDIPVPSF